MPFSEAPWGDEEYEDPFAGWGDDSEDGDSIWWPHDPSPWFSPTKPERKAYRQEMSRMASDFMTGGYLGWGKDDDGNEIQGFAEAFGTEGEGGGAKWGAYNPAGLGWTKWGNYQPQSRVGLSSWGWNYGLGRNAFPILSGAIVAPTINIFTDKIDDEYDSDGRSMSGERGNYRTRVEMRSGRQEVGHIMRLASERGRAELGRLMKGGMSVSEAGLLAERTAKQSVRSQVQPFGRADFGERGSYPYGLREAIKGSANIRFNGDYSLGPKALFQQLGSLGGGYFTKSTNPSTEAEHPERGAWQAYSLDSLYALGWLRSADGGFITGSNKPAKRRQLGVQKLAAPVGADHLMNTGRITGDKLLNTHVVFLSNYAYSEGSGVVDPTLVEGFRSYRPKTIERPMRAGKDWEVDFGPTSDYETVTRRGGFLGLQKIQWNIRKQMGVDWSSAGEDVFIGQQRIGGKMQDLEMLPGKDGVIQNLYGYRKTKSGYQALIETVHPFESGTAKLMHGGHKALFFQSSEIIKGMQQKVRSAIAAGVLPGDVQDPRMVLPMPKDWMQNYFSMFDQLPEETLRGMGISDSIIQSKNWQKSAPEVIDRMKAYADQRRFQFTQEYDVPVSRLGAFTNAGNAKNIQRYMKGDVEFAKFEMEHTGYALPIAAGIRMEYPGKKPMHSAEELMQMGMGGFSDMAKKLMSRGNAASRIWGVAAAAASGAVPKGAISHDMLPWMSARLNLEGDLEDEGTSRKLISNLARELQERGHGRSAIVGPDGVLLPSPADVMGKSVKGLNGQEQSTFVSSYIQALKLMGTGQDPTEALAKFSENLQTFAAGHNVRREALGARLDRGAEGTFTSHMSIPDDVVIVGDSVLRKLGGINRRDPDAQSKMDAFTQKLESGESPFYVLGTRRPVSDMFNQLGVPMRVVTERMAQEQYGVPIENLGRSYAVSPTVAAVWRGDVDADRALLTSATDVKFGARGGFVDEIGDSGEVSRIWNPGSARFSTSREVRSAVNKRDYIMRNQLAALEMRAPDEYKKYVAGLTPGRREAFEKGDTLALSEALHGIDADWNESKKWSDELVKDPQKNLPMGYSYYADASRKEGKTVFTRQEMLAEFEKTAKSKMLMGRGYNRYLRGMTSLAQSPEELQAAVTMASGIYQKALDNQKMTQGELMMFNAMEAWGPGGAMYDKFGKEEGYVGGGAAWTGGAAGIGSVLASAIGDMDAPLSVRAMLFSRDPKIRDAVMTGSTHQILKAIDGGKGEVRGAEEFLYDPARAGILPQLVFSMHFSKGSMTEFVENEPNKWKKAAYQNYAEQGNRIRSMTRVLGRGEKDGLPLSAYTSKNMKGEDVAMPGALGDIRNMGGLNPLPDWQIAMARRMGMGPGFFAGPEAWNKLGIPGRRLGGPVDPNEPYLVGEDGPEVFVPKTAGDIKRLDAATQSRLQNAEDPAAEFKRIQEERQARAATVGKSDPGYDQGTVPPAAGGDASIAHRVFEEFGGTSAFEQSIHGIRTYKANRQKGDPIIPGDRLTRRAVNEIIARGGGEAAMGEWGKIMGRFGVGFRHQIEDSPEGAKQVWSHSYGSLRSASKGAQGDVYSAIQGLSEDQYTQFQSMVGDVMRGVMPDPETFLGGLTEQFMTNIRERKEIGIQSLPALLPIFQQLMGYGDQLEIFQHMSGPESMRTRMKLMPAGLQGSAHDLLADMVQKGLSEGYTPEVKQMMERGYKHSGIGQGMIRSVRSLMDTNLDTANSKQAWSMWDNAQRVRSALGEDAPEALVDRMEKLDETINKLTEVEKKRVDQAQKEIEANPNYKQAQEAFQNAVAAQAAGGSSAIFSPAQSKLFAQLHGIRKMGGMATDDIDQAFEKSELEKGLAGLGGDAKTGKFAALKKLLGLGGPGDDGGDEKGGLGGIFTEMTLGFTAFRARMAWNLTTGAQKGWMNDFLSEEQSAIGAALAGGATAGPSGSLSPFIRSQAAIANTKAAMGEGVAQVYAPLAGAIGGLNMGAGAGAAATLLGTPIGVGSVVGLGAKMIGQGLGESGAGLLANAGKFGMIAAGTTAAVLGTSYLGGLGESWTNQEPGTWEQRTGRAIRPGQIWAEQNNLPNWMGTLVGMGANALTGISNLNIPTIGTTTRDIYSRYMPDDVMRQFALEGSATQPGTLQGDANGLRSYIRSQYGNRVNVDQFLGLTGSALQLGGTRAQDLYEGRAPEIDKLLQKWATYVEGGASPEQLYSSQLTSVNAAGVPMGTQAVSWMNQFASRIPGEQRQIYEQAFQSLSPLSSATMRPTTFEEAQRAVELAKSTGSMQRAVNMTMGEAGVGWFTGTFGLTQEGARAREIGGYLSQRSAAQQETIQRYGGTVAGSAARMGFSSNYAPALSEQLAMENPDDVLRISNLVVQAESVAIEAGMGQVGFQELLYAAKNTNVQDKTQAGQQWFMTTYAGSAGIAPQAWMPHSEKTRDFERSFANLDEKAYDSARTAAGILNQAYPNQGYSKEQLTSLLWKLENGDQSIAQLSMTARAEAGRTGIAAAMGSPLASPGAARIDQAFVLGPELFRGSGFEWMMPDQEAALPGYLNSSLYQYMNDDQKAAIAPALGQAFNQLWYGQISQYQFNRIQEGYTGSTPWGFSAQQGFGPGSLTDRLGRQYGMYSGDPGSSTWTASNGGQYAPLFDLQQGAGYASLGYASAANEAQSRQFARQQAQMRREWGSGPFQSTGAVQSALFGEGAQELGSGVQIGESTIGYAQQESAIRRQMWQESVAAQQQSIQFSRQSLEISRQELGIAKQELELSKQQYGIQREYKLSEQQAQRGMQLRQYEWAAEDYSIKVERTGVTQQWQMEDLQRSRRYSTGRQRVEIERQIERTQLTQGWERDDQSRGRNRELETQRYQDARYEAAVAFEQKLHELQMKRFELQDQRMALQDQRLALQDAQLAAQEARLNNQTVLQEKLNKLEDDRFKAQYEQTQAQMVDDEKMEKLRKSTRDAEIAYQAASLANAATLKTAQEEFAKGLEGIEGPLDKLIEFLNAIRNWQKPPDPVPPTEEENNDSGRSLTRSTSGRSPMGEASMSSTMSGTSGAPTIVNFILDGELIMQAVATPERLRPVVQEVNKRDKWR
jgi:hypothetical protein